MSVEALIPVDRAIENIRSYQADVAEEPPHDIESMMYLLRHEHQIPTSLESIAFNFSQYMAHDAERPTGWRHIVELSAPMPESRTTRHIRLTAPLEYGAGLDPRVRVTIRGQRTMRLRKLATEVLSLHAGPNSQGENDFVTIADDSFHPYL